MSAFLLENTKSNPLSLEIECSHNWRSLLYFAGILEGYKRPLAHSSKGLDLQYLLNFARDKKYFVALSVVVQDLPHTGWSTFPGIYGHLHFE